LKCDTVSVDSEILLSAAATKPLNTEVLTKQLSKLGDTPYELASLENQIEGNCHIAISAINQLRRDLISNLEQIKNHQSKIINHQSIVSIESLFGLVCSNSKPQSPARPPKSTATSKTRVATKTRSKFSDLKIQIPNLKSS
jgi:hypothetical protein